MAIIPIKEINTDVKSASVRVKVYEVCGGKTYSTDDYMSSLEAILVDEEVSIGFELFLSHASHADVLCMMLFHAFTYRVMPFKLQ